MQIGNYYSVYAANAKVSLPQTLPIAGAGGTFNLSQSNETKQASSHNLSGTPSSVAMGSTTGLFNSDTMNAILKGNEVDDKETTETTAKNESNDLMQQLAGMLEGSTPEEMLSEITSMEGYMKWQIKELTKKATAEVMSKMGVTMDELNAMPAEQKLAILKMIMQIVQEKIKLAMEEQMKNKGGNPFMKIPDQSVSLIDGLTPGA